jgi:hypothetical protein
VNEAGPVAKYPDDVWSAGQLVPLERWVLGQYNKLLPAKAACRALANIVNGSKDGADLKEAVERISREAVTLGGYLLDHDRRHESARDQYLSIAFPVDDAEEKGRARFANQFVCAINTKGQLSGLPVDLKLLNRVESRKPRITLTDAGWRFTKLRNPVLDVESPGPTGKFSTEEIDFLLEHIRQMVPVEVSAFRAILEAVVAGADSPEGLGRALESLVARKEASSPSFLASQRSGAVSRMADLGLVVRIRDGVRVIYEVTERGRAFLQSLK